LAPGRRRPGLERPAELRGPLAHRAQSDPWSPCPIGRTVVGDRQFDLLGAAQPDHGTGGLGVAYDIGEGFGRDTVRGHLNRGWQARHLFGNVESNVHGLSIGSPGKLVGSLPQGSNQPELIERRRPEIINQAAYVGQGRSCVVAQGGQQALRLLGIIVNGVRSCVGGKSDASQGRPEPVM
jgi:hypothetical protein